jgi:hypothetical protein
MMTEKFEEYYKKIMAMRHPEVARLLEEVKKIIEEKEGIKVECDRKEDHLA